MDQVVKSLLDFMRLRRINITPARHARRNLIKKGQDKTYPAASRSSAGVIGILYDPEDIRSLVKE